MLRGKLAIKFYCKGKKKKQHLTPHVVRGAKYMIAENRRAPLLLSGPHSQDSCWEMRNTHTSVCSDIREAASPGVLTFKTDTLGQETAA